MGIVYKQETCAEIELIFGKIVQAINLENG